MNLQMAAADARIVQACIMDHGGAGFSSPHMHVFLHFADETTTAWQTFDGLNLMELKATLNRMKLRIRLHIHENKKAAPVAEPTAVSQLPRLKLTADNVACLQTDGASSCSICLSDYKVGDEIVALPCGGFHKAHWECLSNWLGRAATCPVCRFELPSKPSEAADASYKRLVEAAVGEIERIKRTEPAPCQLADDDEEPPVVMGAYVQAAPAELSNAAIRSRVGLTPFPPASPNRVAASPSDRARRAFVESRAAAPAAPPPRKRVGFFRRAIRGTR